MASEILRSATNKGYSVTGLKGPLSIDYTSKIAPRSLFFIKCTHFGRKMGVATTAAPYGFWATNSTKKLAHWVYLLGQPLSRNRVLKNFSGEPPPPPPLNL